MRITTNDNLYLFVYGTLRKACSTGANKQYLQNADYVSTAKTSGQLFMVDYYPGLVTVNTEHWVKGELYSLQDDEQLHHLDLYEGCGNQTPEPHEYKREKVNILLRSGKTLFAWTYLYQLDIANLNIIASGDFLNRY